MTPPVINYGRMNRLRVNEPTEFTMTHACILAICGFVVYLFKRFKDKQTRSRI